MGASNKTDIRDEFIFETISDGGNVQNHPLLGRTGTIRDHIKEALSIGQKQEMNRVTKESLQLLGQGDGNIK